MALNTSKCNRLTPLRFKKSLINVEIINISPQIMLFVLERVTNVVTAYLLNRLSHSL